MHTRRTTLAIREDLKMIDINYTRLNNELYKCKKIYFTMVCKEYYNFQLDGVIFYYFFFCRVEATDL